MLRDQVLAVSRLQHSKTFDLEIIAGLIKISDNRQLSSTSFRMSSSNSTVFRMCKKAKQFLEPSKIVVKGPKIAASINVVAVTEDSEEALMFISEVVSTATNTGEFLKGTIIVPSGPLTNNGESDAENLAGSQNYFYFAKIHQEGRLLLQFRGGLYPESNANLYNERFIGGGINLRVGEYEWSTKYLPSKVLVPSSWLLEASIGNSIVRTEKGESEEGTASATLEEIEQETSRTAGKADDV